MNDKQNSVKKMQDALEKYKQNRSEAKPLSIVMKESSLWLKERTVS